MQVAVCRTVTGHEHSAVPDMMMRSLFSNP